MIYPISVLAGADYAEPADASIRYTDGQSAGNQQCIEVLITDDTYIEDDETFIVSLNAELGVEFFLQTTTVTIVQDPLDGNCHFHCSK